MVVAAILLAACPKHEVPSASSFSASELLRLDAVYRYEEVWDRQGAGQRRMLSRQSYERRPDRLPPEGYEGVVWEARTEQVSSASGAGVVWEATPSTLFVLGPQGWVYFEVLDDPPRPHEPKVQLPPTVSVGMRWSSEQTVDGEVETRACVAESTTACGEGSGLATTCTTLRPGRRIWLRNHFCVGLGNVGFEGVIEAKGRVSHVWDVGATLDGVPLPQRPLTAREFVETADFI